MTSVIEFERWITSAAYVPSSFVMAPGITWSLIASRHPRTRKSAYIAFGHGLIDCSERFGVVLPFSVKCAMLFITVATEVRILLKEMGR